MAETRLQWPPPGSHVGKMLRTRFICVVKWPKNKQMTKDVLLYSMYYCTFYIMYYCSIVENALNIIVMENEAWNSLKNTLQQLVFGAVVYKKYSTNVWGLMIMSYPRANNIHPYTKLTWILLRPYSLMLHAEIFCEHCSWVTLFAFFFKIYCV